MYAHVTFVRYFWRNVIQSNCQRLSLLVVFSYFYLFIISFFLLYFVFNGLRWSSKTTFLLNLLLRILVYVCMCVWARRRPHNYKCLRTISGFFLYVDWHSNNNDIKINTPTNNGDSEDDGSHDDDDENESLTSSEWWGSLFLNNLIWLRFWRIIMDKNNVNGNIQLIGLGFSFAVYLP